jgi:hypothetical protein
MTLTAVTLPDVGLRDIRSLLRVTTSLLVIEIEDALFSEFDNDLATIEMEPAAMEEVSVPTRLLKDRLMLRLGGPQLPDGLPGHHVREVEPSV